MNQPHTINKKTILLAPMLILLLACQFSPLKIFEKPTLTPTKTSTPTATHTPRPTATLRPTQRPTASLTPTDCADGRNPSEQDITYSLNFPKEAFPGGNWERTYDVQPMRVGVTWTHRNSGYLAHLENLIWGCGYTEEDLENSLGDAQYKKVVFLYYQNLEMVNKCQSQNGKLILREFTADFEKKPYLLRHWVVLDSNTRMVSLSLVFPKSAEKDLISYSQKIFPQLNSCDS